MNNQRPQPIPIRPRPSDDPHRENEIDPSPLPADHHLSFPPPSDVLPVEDPAPSPDSDQDLTDLNLRKLYHYLMDFPVMQLRRIAKVWDRRQHGLKKAIVARIYLYVLDGVQEEGHTLEQILATNSKLNTFETWVSNMRLRVVWEKPPTRRELLRIIGGANPNPSDPENDADPDQPVRNPPEKCLADPELSLSEFARLLLLIRSSEQIKRAIFEARKEVLREEETVDRLKFWSVLVEPRFNDKSFIPKLDVDGPFDGVDARRMPARYRSGTDLMNAFGTARQSFLGYLERWRRGGSEDPATFAEVLPRNGRGGGISRTGKRSLMIFKAMKCWSENQDVLMLGLSLKFTMGASIRGTRGSFGGLVRKASEDEDDTDVGSEVRSTARSKRRRRMSGKTEDSPEMGDYTRGVLHAIKMFSPGKAIEEKTEKQLEREEEQHKRDIRMRKLREQASLMKSMEEARRMIREHQHDDEFRSMAEMFYNELKGEFMNIRKQLDRNNLDNVSHGQRKKQFG